MQLDVRGDVICGECLTSGVACGEVPILNFLQGSRLLFNLRSFAAAGPASLPTITALEFGENADASTVTINVAVFRTDAA